MLQGNWFWRKANEVNKHLSTVRMENNFVLGNSQTSQTLEWKYNQHFNQLYWQLSEVLSRIFGCHYKGNCDEYFQALSVSK